MIAYLRYSPRPREKVENDPLGDTMPASFQTQRHLIHQYCDARSMEHPDLWIEEELVSARVFKLHERPGGQELLRAIFTGNRHVIVSSLERLFRDVVDGLETLEDWQARGVVLHSCDGFSLDTSSAHGYLIASMVLTVCAFEPRRTAERTREAKDRQKANNQRTGRYARFGYRFDPDDSSKEIPDAFEIDLMQRIKQWSDAGFSNEEIAKCLNQENVHCPNRTRKQWDRSIIRAIVNAELPAVTE